MDGVLPASLINKEKQQQQKDNGECFVSDCSTSRKCYPANNIKMSPE